MEHEFSPRGGRQLLTEISATIKRGSLYSRYDHPVLFVCGGSVSPDANTMRAQFMAWAGMNLGEYVILLAEDAYRNRLLNAGSEKISLSEFEKIIGDVSDGVIIFPESEGSFAEVGLFSASRSVREKLLVINELRFQTSDSFASLGPLQTIDAKSYLAPTVHVQKQENGTIDFGQLPERLKRVLSRLNSRALVPRGAYGRLTARQRLTAVVAVLSILRVATFWGLYAAVREVFQRCNVVDLRHLLSILIAAGYVSYDEDFLQLSPSRTAPVEFDGPDLEPIRARLLYYYRRNVPKAYAIVMGN